MNQLRMKLTREYPVELLETRWPNRQWSEDIYNSVGEIIDKVRNKGNQAIIEYTKQFDQVWLQETGIQVEESEIDDAYVKVSPSEVNALKESIKRLRLLSESILERLSFEVAFKGLRINVRTSAIESIGCYIPGGTANYPSSVLMCVVPALVAGVRRIVVCTPPDAQGKVNPLTLVACDLTGVEEIYRIGGAQAIASLAYGTETIDPVLKIVGPGNKYVTAAKQLVSKDVPIDMPAGPSELVIIADGTAKPRTVALDLISQAEHDKDAKVLFVTGNESIAERTMMELENILETIPRREVVLESLSKNGLIYVYDSLDEGIRFVNDYAPEHLMILSECAPQIRKRIESAGLVLLGSNSPVAASDYMLGVNHVLPTSGYGKVISGLSVLDYVKLVNEVECSRRGLLIAEPFASLLAEVEGLSNHARAIRGRV